MFLESNFENPEISKFLEVPDTFDAIPYLEKILKKVFPANFHKNVVEELGDRINFACPYCGDSELDDRKKRGNIYKDNFAFKCFNCGIHKPAIHLFEDFLGDEIGQKEKFQLITLFNKKALGFKGASNFNFFSRDSISKFLIAPVDVFCAKLGLKELSGKSLDYVVSRRIPSFAFERLRTDIRTRSNLYILNTITLNNETFVVSFNIRFTKNKFYKIHTFKDVCDIMNVNVDSFPDKLEFDSFNAYANVGNFFNINFNKPIILTEGFFDSIFVPNSLYLSGVSKHIPIEFEKVYLLFDNDKIGRKTMRESLSDNSGKTYVFNWFRFLNETGFGDGFRVKDMNDWILAGGKMESTNIFDFFVNDKMMLVEF